MEMRISAGAADEDAAVLLGLASAALLPWNDPNPNAFRTFRISGFQVSTAGLRFLLGLRLQKCARFPNLHPEAGKSQRAGRARSRVGWGLEPDWVVVKIGSLLRPYYNTAPII